MKGIKEAEDAVKKTKVRIIQAEQLGIPTMKTKIERKVVTPFEMENTDMKPKTDKEKLAEANRELRQLDGRKDHMEWEEWWRQRNIILQRIENIGQRMGEKHKMFEH